MRYVTILIIACILAIANTRTVAQMVYRMNIDNGLPTNFVYNLLIDRHGFLWISTKKGVVRYNGYKPKLFDFSAGLHKEEIWRQYEDKKGRIWLSSISRQIGYLRDDKFHLAVNLSGKLLYPIEIRENDTGIFFISNTADLLDLYEERNDTLYFNRHPMEGKVWLTGRSDQLLLRQNDTLFLANYICSRGKIHFNNRRTVLRDLLGENRYSYVLGRYRIDYYEGTSNIRVIDLSSGKDSLIDLQKITLTKQKIQSVFAYNDSYFKERAYFLVLDSSLYFMDSTLTFRQSHTFDRLLHKGMTSNKISYYQTDTLWNEILATYTDGIYISSKPGDHFREVTSLQLSDFRYVGNDAVHNHYWWNGKNYLLAKIDERFNAHMQKHEGLRLQSITPYSRDSSVVSTWNGIYWLDNKNLQLHNYLAPFRQRHSNFNVLRMDPIRFEVYNIIFSPGHTYFHNGNGVAELLTNSRDSININFFSFDRFAGIAHDSLRQNLWLYNNDYVEVYHNRRKLVTLSPAVLQNLKIKNIERILTDRYGNVFVQGYDKLLMFDDDIRQYRALFHNYMLNGAIVQIAGNILVVGGKFGILFCKINGKGRISQPVVYENIKSIAYNYITDMQVSDSAVLLQTDRKLYSAVIPSDSILNNVKRPALTSYKLLFLYNDHFIDIKKGDTVRIDQDNASIRFDVINPLGNGEPVYNYKIAGVTNDWTTLTTADLLLADLRPGKYYRLSLVINDAVWRSNPVSVYIYIPPYWWQKRGWILSFWISGFVALLLFGLIVAKVTRSIVTRANERKNAMLELELKAIYSQINPHFIYNTLNSALLLIRNNKMEEAYKHVFKFSRLLRAYVKSSRNKYITLHDEIANIKNYIELQQTRFKDRFSYDIAVHEGVNTDLEKIPALLLQPFIENAINHGLLNKEGKGRLDVKFAATPGAGLVCIIEDDGIGREQSKQISRLANRQDDSFGNEMIKDLVTIFNRYEDITIEIKITDKALPMTGTIVEIYIKRQAS